MKQDHQFVALINTIISKCTLLNRDRRGVNTLPPKLNRCFLQLHLKKDHTSVLPDDKVCSHEDRHGESVILLKYLADTYQLHNFHQGNSFHYIALQKIKRKSLLP